MFINHSIISYKSTNSWHGVQKWIVPSNENSNWINVFRKLWKRIIYNIYKKNFNTLELTLGTEVNSIVHCCWYRAVPEGVSCQDCWHDTTTATMWGSGTNVIRPDQTTNFEMKLDYGYTTAPCNTIFSKACWREFRKRSFPTFDKWMPSADHNSVYAR